MIKTMWQIRLPQKKSDRWEQAVSVLEKRKQLFRQAGLLLHDRTQTAIVLVMTADVLPLAETKRAIEQLEDSKLMPAAIVVNQLISTTQSDDFGAAALSVSSICCRISNKALPSTRCIRFTCNRQMYVVLMH